MNEYSVLKCGATGAAAPDMSAYDKLRAIAMAGGAEYPVTTITGVPPLRFRSDGSPLSAWTIAGNSRQDGTPTPEFVGEKTENCLSEKYENRSINGVGAFTIDNNYDLWLGEVSPGETYTISNMDAVYGFFNAKPLPNTGATYNGRRGYEISGTAVVTIPAGCTWIAVRVLHNADNAMLNTGSTALPYEPYGCKISITCAGQTATIYIGDPLRKAIDGTDVVDVLSSAGTITREVDADGNALATPTTQTIDVPPEIQTVRGINTLTVGTTLQPSEMTITGHIKPL